MDDVPEPETLSIGIDIQWLEKLFAAQPLANAYALWDFRQNPDRTQFVTLVRNGAPQGYLLIWRGAPDHSTVHWMSEGPHDEKLLAALPERPLVVLAPERCVKAVVAHCAPATTRSVDLMEHAGSRLRIGQKVSVRPLKGTDKEGLRALAQGDPEKFMASFARLDLERARTWGAFDGTDLVSFARAAVIMPSIWVIDGIYTDPGHRGKGFGGAVTAAATNAALEAGARAGLYSYSDNLYAMRLYQSLGYRTVERMVMVDATGKPPRRGLLRQD